LSDDAKCAVGEESHLSAFVANYPALSARHDPRFVLPPYLYP
jgi:hypothetical protein